SSSVASSSSTASSSVATASSASAGAASAVARFEAAVLAAVVFTAGLRVLRFAGVLVSAARLVPVARFVPADDSDSAVTAVSSVVVSAVLEEVTEFLLPAERLAGLRHTRVISHLGVALGS